MKKILILLLTFFIFISTTAQKTGRTKSFDKNTVFIEFLGNTGALSVNYDRLLFQSPKVNLAGRIGYAYLPVKFTISGIPFEISALFSGEGNHHFELGTGLSYIKGFEYQQVIMDFTGWKEYTSESLYVPVRVGYRYQREKGGVFIKAGIVPLIGIYDFEKYYHNKSYVWLGFGVGYTF